MILGPQAKWKSQPPLQVKQPRKSGCRTGFFTTRVLSGAFKADDHGQMI
jgi:hypothetical protein